MAKVGGKSTADLAFRLCKYLFGSRLDVDYEVRSAFAVSKVQKIRLGAYRTSATRKNWVGQAHIWAIFGGPVYSILNG